MPNCSTCQRPLSPGASHCDHCGSPVGDAAASGDAPTSIGSATWGAGQGPGQPGQPGQDSGGSGVGNQPVGGHGWGDAGAGSAQGGYGGGYGGDAGGSGYGGSGYGGSGYGGSGYGGSGYGDSGYGGYGGGQGDGSGPRQGKKKTWLIVWSLVGVLVLCVLGLGVWLATSGDGDDEADGGGGEGSGGDTSGTESAAAARTDPSGLLLGANNTLEVDDGEVRFELTADDDQIVILSSDDVEDAYVTADYELATTSAAASAAGVYAFVPERDGEQDIEIYIYDDIDEIEVYLDVIDKQDLEADEELTLGEQAPLGAAVYTLDGIYDFNDVVTSCSAVYCSVADSDVLVVTDEDFTADDVLVDTVTGTFEGGATTLAYTMPPGGGSVPFTVAEDGVVALQMENLTDGEIDTVLTVTDSSGAEVCRDDGIGRPELCVFEVTAGQTYTAGVTDYSEDPASTGGVSFSFL